MQTDPYVTDALVEMRHRQRRWLNVIDGRIRDETKRQLPTGAAPAGAPGEVEEALRLLVECEVTDEVRAQLEACQAYRRHGIRFEALQHTTAFEEFDDDRRQVEDRSQMPTYPAWDDHTVTRLVVLLLLADAYSADAT